MLILTVRTDKPEAELSLYEDKKLLSHSKWLAHRELAETIHQEILKLLKGVGKDWLDIEGIGAYKGPGSFTGLRIGLTVVNSLAQSLSLPIVGATGDVWEADCVNGLLLGENQKVVAPEYGADVHITLPKK